MLSGSIRWNIRNMSCCTGMAVNNSERVSAHNLSSNTDESAGDWNISQELRKVGQQTNELLSNPVKASINSGFLILRKHLWIFPAIRNVAYVVWCRDVARTSVGYSTQGTIIGLFDINRFNKLVFINCTVFQHRWISKTKAYTILWALLVSTRYQEQGWITQSSCSQVLCMLKLLVFKKSVTLGCWSRRVLVSNILLYRVFKSIAYRDNYIPMYLFSIFL